MKDSNAHASETRSQLAEDQYVQGLNPVTRQALPERYALATPAEVDAAVRASAAEAAAFAKTSGAVRAELLRQIASEIEQLGDALTEMAVAETGLLSARIIGERARTCGQLRAFALLVEEGSWVDARIDPALPDRQPLPRPDLRKCAIALGPVAVFSASNFPLAFSAAGGDTASALAAGCPVLLKAHPAHPGTQALVATAVQRALASTGLSPKLFTLLQGGVALGQQLVQHPDVEAVGFTGSLRAGRAICDLAAARPRPIPVFAEMGSINPVFLLPQKLAADAESLAHTLAASVQLGAGQFCTSPGIIVFENSEASTTFMKALSQAFSALEPATMLSEGIFRAFRQNRAAVAGHPAIQALSVASDAEDSSAWSERAGYATVSVADFMANPCLQEEVFGPFVLLVFCADDSSMLALAEAMPGQLTASIFANNDDAAQAQVLAEALARRVGRLIYNAVPTGVEVSPAMHHGGPYPAANQAAHTSVGTDAIRRWTRPVCYQNTPQAFLPEALREGNPLGIWRHVDGQLSRT